MQYICDDTGHLVEVSFGADIECGGKTCQTYDVSTRGLPDGYASMLDWYLANADTIYRWIVPSNIGVPLILDESIDQKDPEAVDYHWLNADLKVAGEIYAGSAYDKAVWHAGNFPIEAGEWTPTLGISGSGSNPTATYTKQYGNYWRIGPWVYVAFYLKFKITEAGEGNASVLGLPFVCRCSRGSNMPFGFSVTLFSGSPTTDSTGVTCLTYGGLDCIRVWKTYGRGSVAWNVTSGDAYLCASGWYPIE